MADSGGERAKEAGNKSSDGRAVVEIVPGGMEVLVRVYPPQGGGKPLEREVLLAQLQRAGVTCGLDDDALAQVLQPEQAPLPPHGEPQAVVVATGKPPLLGKDAFVTFSDVLSATRAQPRVREDGSVDYLDLGGIHNVAEGTVLATKTQATKGLPGANVKRQPVPARDGRDVPLPAGRGTRISDDGLQLLAAVAGHPSLGGDGKIHVSPVYHVAGDVDLSTGNIDFIGSVVVHGNICQGLTVRAGTDVEVMGGIEGGSVIAGGNVSVRFGIRGGGHGQIEVGGWVRARFIEGGDVRAGGEVRIAEGILHSRVRSGSKVVVEGRRGSIIGGQVRAREEVVARVLGSQQAVPTEVSVGVSPEVREELEAVRQQLADTEDNLRRTSQVVAHLRELEHSGELSEEKRNARLKSVRGIYQLQAQRTQLSSRLEQLTEEVRQASQGRVRADQIVFPQVRITIGEEVLVVGDPVPSATYRLSEEHTIVLGRS